MNYFGSLTDDQFRHLIVTQLLRLDIQNQVITEMLVDLQYHARGGDLDEIREELSELTQLIGDGVTAKFADKYGMTPDMPLRDLLGGMGLDGPDES